MFVLFRSSVVQARRNGDLYFAALLDRETIIEALDEASSLGQGWIYTPAATCWTFLSQRLIERRLRESRAEHQELVKAFGLAPS